MDRVQLSETLNFSRIVYGMWRIGDDADTSVSHVQAKIHACLDRASPPLIRPTSMAAMSPRRSWGRR